MKLNIILLIILFSLSIFTGYLQCLLGTCFTTIPILSILALVIAVVSVIHIFKSKKIKKELKYLSFLLLVVYPIGAVITAWLLIGVFTQRSNNEYAKQQAQRQENSKKGIPDIGTISKQGSSYIYECIPCKFKITFPDSWKYKTDQTDYGNTTNPYLTLYISNDPQFENFDFLNNSYHILSYPSKDVENPAELNKNSLNGDSLGYKVENIKINGIDYRVSKKLGDAKNISENYDAVYIFSQYKDRKIIISLPSKYPNEPTDQEIKDTLSIVEKLQFIN